MNPPETVRFVVVCLAFCVIASPIAGQTTFGSITGSVTDPSGSVVPGAVVTVTNEGTGAERRVTTANPGSFNVPNLAVGSYRIRIEAAGFGAYQRAGLSLNANQVINVDARLEVASAIESVVVAGTTPLINTETQTLSYVKTNRDLEQLPLVARSAGDFGIYGFTYSNPGVSRHPSQSNPAVNGGRILDTQLSIDGIAVMAYVSGQGGGVTQPSMEGIEQVNIELAGTQAEFAHAANFTVVTKSGTNQYHGTAFYDYNGNSLNARDFFATTVPFRVYNNFGASLGGPIRRNKTFFFGDYEASREAAAVVATGNTPLVPWRSGDFSGLSTKLTDPSTGQPFQDNRIPDSRISLVSRKIQDYFFPLPNFGPPTLQSGNWRGLKRASTGYTIFDHFDVRGDHIVSPRDTVFGRFGFRRLPRFSSDSNTPLPPAGINHEIRFARTGVLSWTHSFSPTLLNEVRAGFSRMHQLIEPTLIGSSILNQAGVQGIGISGAPSSPAFVITGISPTGNGSPWHLNVDTNYEVTDNISLTRGSHFLKFGLDVIRDQVSGFGEPVSIYGTYNFTNTYTGFGYADFLLGIPQSTTRSQASPTNYLLGTLWAFYAQDEYKVSRSLTLNFGFRYELTTPYHDKYGDIFSFDRRTGAIVVPDAGVKNVNPLFPKNLPIVPASQVGVPSGSLIETDKNNLYPRFGFAYKPFGSDKTVIRGGYGIYDNAIYSSLAFYQMTGGPFSGSETFTNKLTNGVPLFSFPNPFLSVGAASTQNVSGVNPHLRTPYMQQFSLTVERQVGSVGLRVGYVGSRNTGLVYQANINQPPASAIPYSANRRFYPLYNIVTWYDNGGTEQYNGLQISASRSYGENFSFNTGFTWAKDLTDTQTTGAFAVGPMIQDQFNRRAERGPNVLTRSRRVYINAIYAVPVGRDQRFLKNANRYINGIVGGWSTSWVSEIESGQYYTPTFSGSDPSNTNSFGPSTNFIARPDRIGNGVLSSGQSIQNWFDTSAFAVPGCPDSNPVCSKPANVGRFGDSGVNILRGPQYVNVDFSAMKYFRINERTRVQLRVLATNVFNHPNFATPQANISSLGTVGRINSTFQEQLGEATRQVHFNLRVEF